MTVEVLRAKLLRNQVFWDVTLCSRESESWHFDYFIQEDSSPLKIKVTPTCSRHQQPLIQWRTSHPRKPQFSICGFWVIVYSEYNSYIHCTQQSVLQGTSTWFNLVHFWTRQMNIGSHLKYTHLSPHMIHKCPISAFFLCILNQQTQLSTEAKHTP